jgi:hypothetical protein
VKTVGAYLAELFFDIISFSAYCAGWIISSHKINIG